MKGWIILEDEKPVISSSDDYTIIEVFLKKKDLLKRYCHCLGERNSIKRIEV